MKIRTLKNNIVSKFAKKDFSSLKTDFHSHLLPGLDDGAESVIDSIVMLKNLKKLGFKKIITTPHIRSSQFNNSNEIILKASKKMHSIIKKNKIGIEFGVAAEYYMDRNFSELLRNNDLLSFAGNHVLMEMSFMEENEQCEENIFNMRIKKYKPIMAHPERYGYWFGDIKRYKRIKEMGCEFQINLLSLSGHYGTEVKKAAQTLLKNDLVDYLCTDLHNLNQMQELIQFSQTRYFSKIMRSNKYKNALL